MQDLSAEPRSLYRLCHAQSRIIDKQLLHNSLQAIVFRFDSFHCGHSLIKKTKKPQTIESAASYPQQIEKHYAPIQPGLSEANVLKEMSSLISSIKINRIIRIGLLGIVALLCLDISFTSFHRFPSRHLFRRGLYQHITFKNFCQYIF